MQALFEPGKLFGAARLDRGAAQAGFAVLTGSVFWVAGQVLERFLLAGQREQLNRMLERMQERGPLGPFLKKILDSTHDSSPRTMVLMALLTPLAVLVLVYLNAAVTHAAALLFGRAKRGFAATFAACAYACAPLVLLALPGCGGIIAIAWTAVLTGVGLKQTHQMRPGAAAASVLAPYLLLCCAACAAGAAITMAAMRGMPR